MIIGSLLLLALFFLPMWNISLEAPQYPEPIGMDIWINKFADHNPNDIKNINIMNHYVGMKDIPESIPEFEIFPIVVVIMSLLGVIVGFIGRYQLYLIWFILAVGLGTTAMYDFYQWEYDYGHNLKGNAAIKFTDAEGEPMAYQPPLIGKKRILNFNAISMPMSGAYLMFLGMGLTLVAFAGGLKYKKNKAEIPLHVAKAAAVGVLLFFSSCQIEPAEIAYGSDACHYCKMTIVDKAHAAQIVSTKGKAFKYDAIECMMNDLKDRDSSDIGLMLVADYSHPGQQVNAEAAHFLVSEEIPSPMGAFLSAFSSTEDRVEVSVSNTGTAFTWEELKNKFR